MLFVFRGIRYLQGALAFIALCAGVACVVVLEDYASNKTPISLVLALLFAVIFLWGFATALRAPTSFVAIADNRTRIRYAGFVDTVIDNNDVLAAKLVKFPWYGGIGVRTSFGGSVALISSWGEVCELTLRRPIRVWLIPRLLPVRATTVQVSVRNPQKMVDRFVTGVAPSEAAAASPSGRSARKMRQRRR